MEFHVDYVIVLLIVLLSAFFLYKKIRKSVQKGKCASCPVYDECEKGHKVNIEDLK